MTGDGKCDSNEMVLRVISYKIRNSPDALMNHLNFMNHYHMGEFRSGCSKYNRKSTPKHKTGDLSTPAPFPSSSDMCNHSTLDVSLSSVIQTDSIESWKVDLPPVV